MQLSVQGKQLDVGDALRTHVDDALSRTLGKYFGDAVEVKVTLSRERHLYRAVVSAHIGRGIHLEAQGEANEPYPAFDMAADRLSTRLRRHKRRLRDHHKDLAESREVLTAQSYILAGEPGDEEYFEEEEIRQDGDGEPMVIAEMTTKIESLTVSDAVMRMSLADAPVLMFRNSAHGGLNVVYRREDGNIGWIDPRGNRGTETDLKA
jgi:ribosomal subunit interface protein